MTLQEISNLVNHSADACLGFTDGEGNPSIRKVFSTWHKGLGTHLISTNVSSMHVQALLKDDRACLYFNDSAAGVCFTGKAVVHCDHEHKALMWEDGCERYYPEGVDDPDYCVVEFIADSGRYYRFDGKGDISAQELASYDKDARMKDYAAKTAM